MIAVVIGYARATHCDERRRVEAMTCTLMPAE